MLYENASGFTVLAESKSLRLIDAGRESRRSMADVIDVLRRLPNFSESMEAVVRATPLQLPSGHRTALIQIVCEAQGFAVSLPSAAYFRAIRNPSLGPERFEILRLDGAKVDMAGNVALQGATIIHGVQVVPTFVPPKLIQTEERIIAWVVRCFHPRKRCFRYLPNPGIPHPLRRRAKLGRLDYGTLHSLELPPLKKIECALKEMDGFGHCSRQTIASALAKSGMRPRGTRRSQKRI
jgi:hypothetical protein